MHQSFAYQAPHLPISFTGNPLEILFGSRLSSIEHASIDVNVAWISEKFPSVLLSWLVEFSAIKSLVVSSTTLQVYHNRIYELNVFQNVSFLFHLVCVS
jgi:hypothetical protein